jgi:phosphoribosylglycinamide formyltransferase-1
LFDPLNKARKRHAHQQTRPATPERKTAASFAGGPGIVENHARMRGDKSIRLGVLGSGTGSNFVAIHDAVVAGRLQAEVAVVLSDVPDSGILRHARDRGVPAEFMNPGRFRTRLEDSVEEACAARMLSMGVDVVVLAGFMRILKAGVLAPFDGRVLNIHPSLLPAFPGLRAWQQAVDHGVRVSGCTVHLVDQGIDTGPILAQRAVPVRTGDTAEILHERIQQEERSLYPQVLQAWARGWVRVRGRRVEWDPEAERRIERD